MKTTCRVGVGTRKITPSLAELINPVESFVAGQPDIAAKLADWHPGKHWHDTSFKAIHDDLFVRTLVLDDGLRKVVLVTLDIQNTAFALAMRAKIVVVTGLEHDAIFLCPSHTHTAPSNKETAYWNRVTDEVAGSVADALATLQPAVLGLACGEAPFNRNRLAVVDGQGLMTSYATVAQLEGFTGPIDRELLVFAFRTPAGKPLALLYNYTAHPTLMFASGQISADWPGEVARRVEPDFGAPVLFINGAIGDAEPVDKEFGDAAMARMGARVAGRILELVPRVDCRETLSLAYAWDRMAWSERQTWRVGALRLTDDMAFAHCPCELFNSLGVEIKKRSPFARTFVALGRSNNKNDGGTYVSDRRGLEIGSYGAEGWRSPLWGDMFVEKSLELLERVRVADSRMIE